MRKRFNEQLEELHLDLIKMGALCEDIIDASMKALFEKDSAMVKKAESIESDINDMERTIENSCMKLLLQQQPVARDLRTISSALKMISDMERIGDQAEDIAEITEYIADDKIIGEHYLRQMSKAASKMVTDAIESFVKHDTELATSVIMYDNTVDELFQKMKSELIEEIASDRTKGETCFDIMMIAKYIERIGDHAENVAEWVIYSVTGVHPTKRNVEGELEVTLS